jgi:CheY-like chemotaxis protein
MNKKILLADDDLDDRQIFAEALAAIDPKIVCEGAADGKEALKLLSTAKNTRPPNVIFLDINMPVLDGWEVLKKVKSEQLLVNIPVIMYSTTSGIREKQIAEDLGANCFVTKPDNFKLVKSMLEIVIRHIDNQRSAAEMCLNIHRMLSTG